MKSRKSTFLACCYFFLQKIQMTLIADKILVSVTSGLDKKQPNGGRVYTGLQFEGVQSAVERKTRGSRQHWRCASGTSRSISWWSRKQRVNRKWGWVIKPKSCPGDLLKGSQSSRTMPPAGDEISKRWAFRRMFHIPITTGDSIWFTLKRILLLL